MIISINWNKVTSDMFVMDKEVNQIVLKTTKKDGSIATINPYMGMDLRNYTQ